MRQCTVRATFHILSMARCLRLWPCVTNVPALFPPFSLRPEQWNYLDFVVVVVGYLGLLPSVGNVSAIRIFRVLRALRTLTLVPSLNVIVRAMLQVGHGLRLCMTRCTVAWLFVSPAC